MSMELLKQIYNYTFNNINLLLTDDFLFWFFELLLVSVFIYFLYLEIFKKIGAVRRGGQSVMAFFAFFAIISSFYYTLATLIDGQYRILILVINYTLIFNLCFRNGRFRNKLIGIKAKISSFME